MNNNINVNVSGPVQSTSQYKTVVLKGNQPFALQVTEPNIKYVVKHNFDLGGESVTISEGCLLEFDGGSIANGTLVGQDTVLIYFQSLDEILPDVIREGSFVYNNTLSADEESLTEKGNLVSIKDKGIKSEHIDDNQILSKHIGNNQILTNHILNENITGNKLNPNVVDDEDIHFTVDHKLQLKDKAYTPAAYSGMGRVYLRKNIVNGANILTQDMFYKGEVGSRVPNTNTIFVIQYDYDLNDPNGENPIIIPANCVLEFDGGSLSNGTITGQNTGINAGITKIFNTDVTLSGTWNVTESYPEWFGSESDVDNINKALDYFYNVKLSDKEYVIDKVDANGYGIVLKRRRTLRGIRVYENISGATSLLTVASNVECVAAVYINSCCLLEDISIRGNKEDLNACVKSIGATECTLNRVSVSGTYYGFDLQVFLTSITQCTASYNEIGFYLHGSISNDTLNTSYTSLNINTCYAVDSRSRGFYLRGIVYSTMNNCAADGCGVPSNGTLTSSTSIGYAYYLSECRGITLNSCGLERGLRGVYLFTSHGIIFNALNFYFAIRDTLSVDSSFVFKNIFNIQYSVGNEINRPIITYSQDIINNYLTDSSQLILIEDSANSKNIAVTFNEAYSLPKITSSNFALAGGSTIDSYIYNDSKFLSEETSISNFLSLRKSLSNNRNAKYLSYAFSGNNYDDSISINNYAGKVYINGNNSQRELTGTIVFSKGTFYIRNLWIKLHPSVTSILNYITVNKGAKVIFEHCTFAVTKEPTSFVVNISDGSAEFYDCIIYWGVGNRDNVHKFCRPDTIFKAKITTLESISTTTKVTLPFGEYYDSTDKILAIGSSDYKHLINLTNIVHFSVFNILYKSEGIWDSCEFYNIDTNIKYQGLGNTIIYKSGPSSDRPTSALTSAGATKTLGFEFFDKDLKKPIYWDGTGWVDATGATV